MRSKYIMLKVSAGAGKSLIEVLNNVQRVLERCGVVLC
jgi:hypothetical protein